MPVVAVAPASVRSFRAAALQFASAAAARVGVKARWSVGCNQGEPSHFLLAPVWSCIVSAREPACYAEVRVYKQAPIAAYRSGPARCEALIEVKPLCS
jgi:hypothetical protein